MKADRIDWSQLWYPGPTRSFSDDELACAGGDRPSRTLVAGALVNFALLGFMLLQAAPPTVTAPATLLLALCALLGWRLTTSLWRRPSRRALTLWTMAATMLLVGAALLLTLAWGFARRSEAAVWLLALGVGLALLLTTGGWFVAVYRAHQIEARLREQADQARALAMAAQLATAQIQPHFLYNTLASLQHWVHSGDARAALLLTELTAFLRATLPLFNRKLLRLGDEAEAARRYLAVMQLRLGERLHFDVAIDPDAADLQVPPGLLLTLVENAVEHGVQGSLQGAEVRVRAAISKGVARISVQDTGPGCRGAANADGSVSEGIGLNNSRERLQQAFGAQARLTLEDAPGGGCVARIEWPVDPATEQVADSNAASLTTPT